MASSGMRRISYWDSPNAIRLRGGAPTRRWSHAPTGERLPRVPEEREHPRVVPWGPAVGHDPLPEARPENPETEQVTAAGTEERPVDQGAQHSSRDRPLSTEEHREHSRPTTSSAPRQREPGTSSALGGMPRGPGDSDSSSDPGFPRRRPDSTHQAQDPASEAESSGQSGKEPGSGGGGSVEPRSEPSPEPLRLPDRAELERNTGLIEALISGHDRWGVVRYEHSERLPETDRPAATVASSQRAQEAVDVVERTLRSPHHVEEHRNSTTRSATFTRFDEGPSGVLRVTVRESETDRPVTIQRVFSEAPGKLSGDLADRYRELRAPREHSPSGKEPMEVDPRERTPSPPPPVPRPWASDFVRRAPTRRGATASQPVRRPLLPEAEPETTRADAQDAAAGLGRGEPSGGPQETGGQAAGSRGSGEGTEAVGARGHGASQRPTGSDMPRSDRLPDPERGIGHGEREPAQSRAPGPGHDPGDREPPGRPLSDKPGAGDARGPFGHVPERRKPAPPEPVGGEGNRFESVRGSSRLPDEGAGSQHVDSSVTISRGTRGSAPDVRAPGEATPYRWIKPDLTGHGDLGQYREGFGPDHFVTGRPREGEPPLDEAMRRPVPAEEGGVRPEPGPSGPTERTGSPPGSSGYAGPPGVEGGRPGETVPVGSSGSGNGMTLSTSLLERLDRLTRTTSHQGGGDAASATTSSSLEPAVDDPVRLAPGAASSDEEPFDVPAGGLRSRLSADPGGRSPRGSGGPVRAGGRPSTSKRLPRVSSDPHGFSDLRRPVDGSGQRRTGPSSVTGSLLDALAAGGLGGPSRSSGEQASRVKEWLSQVPEGEGASSSGSIGSPSEHASTQSDEVPEISSAELQDNLLREALRQALPRWDVPPEEANRVADLLAASWRNARPGSRFDRALRFFTTHNSIRDLEEELGALYDRAREHLWLGILPTRDEELTRAFEDVSGALIRLMDEQFHHGPG